MNVETVPRKGIHENGVEIRWTDIRSRGGRRNTSGPKCAKRLRDLPENGGHAHGPCRAHRASNAFWVIVEHRIHARNEGRFEGLLVLVAQITCFKIENPMAADFYNRLLCAESKVSSILATGRPPRYCVTENKNQRGGFDEKDFAPPRTAGSPSQHAMFKILNSALYHQF